MILSLKSYSDDELEFYKFLYDELENANLHEGELEKLKSQINAIETINN